MDNSYIHNSISTVAVGADNPSQKMRTNSLREKAVAAVALAAIIAITTILAVYGKHILHKYGSAVGGSILGVGALGAAGAVAVFSFAINIIRIAMNNRSRKSPTYDDLYYDILDDEVSKISSIISAGSPLEGTFEDWSSALRLACKRGNLELVRFLLSDRRMTRVDEVLDDPETIVVTETNSRLVDLFSSLVIRLANGSLENKNEIIALLLSNHRMLSCTELRQRVLFPFVRSNNVEQVGFLVSQARSMGQTISIDALEQSILLAVVNGHPEVLEVLLRSSRIYEHVLRSAIGLAHRVEDVAARESLLNLLSSAPVRPYRNEPPLPRHDTWLVNLDAVKANPKDFLLQIASAGVPRRIAIEGSHQAVDLGGVTKQFLATLFAACLDKGLFSINAIGIPNAIDATHREYLETMGKFFNQLVIRNKERQTDHFLIGEIFGVPFYYLVKTCIEQPEISDEELLQEVASESSKDPDLKVAAQLVLNPQDEAYTTAYLKQGLVGTKEECLESARSYLEGYVEGIRAFTGVLDPEVKALFSSKTPEELQVYFQGEPCTVEALLAALTINESVEQTRIFQQNIEWLREKIRGSDLEWRKRFVAAITGNQMLNPTKKISIRASHRVLAFEVHTCLNFLDIPKEAMEREAFLNLLDWVIKFRGYNTG